VNLLDTSPDHVRASQTAPIDPIREALPVVAYLVTGLAGGEPSMCFEDERGDYGDEEHTLVFEELCLLSDAEAAFKAKDAVIEALKGRPAFTEEQCIDLFAAALYISARGDETSVLSEVNAERIVEFLGELSGIDVDAVLKEPS
jgi:hypothetical protein